MKIQITEALRTRLKNTAFNGSRIAKDILKEINKNCDVSKILKGKSNYFGTKIYKENRGDDLYTNSLVITCCSKDVNNTMFPDYGNPNAPWNKKHRTEINASTFAGLFKNLPAYTSEEMQFFESAIVINSKILIRKMDKEVGFNLAYDCENYTRLIQKREATLWNSCMRSEPYCSIAADFYGNLCKAKVIIAQDMDGYTYGRAIVWEGLESSYGKVSLLDRIYFSHDFVYKMIQNYAMNTGVTFKKRSNTYDSQMWMVNMNHPDLQKDEAVEVALYKELRLSRWYKKGVPYMDTMDKLVCRNKKLYLTNARTSCVSDLKTTAGYCSYNSGICPVCGNENINYRRTNKICNNCKNKYAVDTDFGPLWKNNNLVECHDEYFPDVCFKDKKPKKGLRNWIILKLITTGQ